MKMPSEERIDEMAAIVEKLGFEFDRVLSSQSVMAFGLDRRTGQLETVFLRIVEDKVHVYTFSHTVKIP